jgi:hypothetical protein
MQFPTSNTEINASDGTERQMLTTILKQHHGLKPPEILQTGPQVRSTGADYATTSTDCHTLEHGFIFYG